jgi:hypothetical protein
MHTTSTTERHTLKLPEPKIHQREQKNIGKIILFIILSTYRQILYSFQALYDMDTTDTHAVRTRGVQTVV